MSISAPINIMYSCRKAYSKVTSDVKIKKALRYKVRAMKQTYNSGETVYYKRDSDRGLWPGLATVLELRGMVYFLEHQGDIVRVAACTLVNTEEAEEQIGNTQEVQPQITKLEERQSSGQKLTQGLRSRLVQSEGEEDVEQAREERHELKVE